MIHQIFIPKSEMLKVELRCDKAIELCRIPAGATFHGIKENNHDEIVITYDDNNSSISFDVV